MVFVVELYHGSLEDRLFHYRVNKNGNHAPQVLDLTRRKIGPPLNNELTEI